MFLHSTRSRKELSEVLLNPQSEGPDPVYVVFSGVEEGEWENATIISNGFLDKEFPKTYGHYHPENSPIETYKVLEGEGAFLLQEKFIENGQWVQNRVKTVALVKATKNETITITPNWGHSSSNLGTGPLVTLDNWKNGHTPADYEQIKQLKGMAYYLTQENGGFSLVKNTNYVDLPTPLIMTAEEFAKYQKENI